MNSLPGSIIILSGHFNFREYIFSKDFATSEDSFEVKGSASLYTPTAGDRDSEKFVNPDIKSVQINIDGVPNMLYSKGMLPTDQWESIKQRFPRSLESEVTETKFYIEDKFALWVDLRSHADNEIHGSGLALKDTRDGVKLAEVEISLATCSLSLTPSCRKVGVEDPCDMFIVADALMQIQNSNLNAILY